VARHWAEGWEQMMDDEAWISPTGVTLDDGEFCRVSGIRLTPRKPSLEDRIATLEKRVAELEKKESE
jgi:hypothetical protein